MSRFRVMLFAVISIVLVFPASAQSGAANGAQENPMVGLLDELGGVPCDASDFTCVTLTVPLDHLDGTTEETLDVLFAVLPATGESMGLFVTVMGGPGYSGLEYADSYSSYFDPLVLENYDIVFFDQRGLGLSGGLDCAEATAAYNADRSHPLIDSQEQAYLDATETFVTDCVAEMDGGDILPYLGTRQAIHDLEAFRQAVGSPQMVLYGESYGTQFSQEYATAFPDALSGLILDGVVDLSLTGEAFYEEQAAAFSETLTASLEACNADAACAADFGTGAVAFYDQLSADLLAQPLTVDFPLPSGVTVPRDYTLDMLESSAVVAAYGRPERAAFVRALAAGANGDWLPLLRLGYVDAGIDPQTAAFDIAYGEGAAPYYLIECNDYSFGSGTPDERAQAFITGGDAVEAVVPRLSSIYYTDLPCVYWPVEGTTERPEPFTGGAYTTFILNTSTDPATPSAQGYGVFSNIENAVMITQQGGPHVIFGREDTCPDAVVTAWMVGGVLPPAREFICAGGVLGEYTPLSFVDEGDAAAVVLALDTEIQALPEYVSWDVYTPLLVGCPYGGVMAVAAADDGERFTFAGCAWFEGFVMNGTGEWLYDVSLTLDLTLSGAADGMVSYLRDDTAGMYSITGTYGGEDIALVP